MQPTSAVYLDERTEIILSKLSTYCQECLLWTSILILQIVYHLKSTITNVTLYLVTTTATRNSSALHIIPLKPRGVEIICGVGFANYG